MRALRFVTIVLAMFVTACGGTPTAPSGTSSSTPSGTSSSTSGPDSPWAPFLPSSFDLSPFVGVWDVTLRLTEVKDVGCTGCVYATMQSQIGVPTEYVLTITEKDVTLASGSGDYTSVFYADFKTESTGFTTVGARGFYTANTLSFRCSDGTTHRIYTFGEDISGRLSGTMMAGEWKADWYLGQEESWVGETTAEFTGRRR